MRFLDLFKFKKHYKDFIISTEVLNKKPICYGNLFKALGIDKEIEKLCLDGKYHYKNIRANSNTIKSLDTKMEYNLLKTKNMYSKIYKENALKTMAIYDRLMFAPNEDNMLKDNIIRILLPTHKNYTEAIER